MRIFVILLGFAGLLTPMGAQTRVTVAQLEQFLTSKSVLKEPDAEIADRLRTVELSEQLTAKSFARVASEANLGPGATEQLRLMAAASIFNAPPSDELPTHSAPDQAAQKAMIDLAVAYVDGALHRLPNFLATRTTDSFVNSPRQVGSKRTRPKADFHLVRESHREIAYRNGQEILDSTSGASAKNGMRLPADAELTTWGEFGPVLKTVLGDSFKGSVVWNRWETGEAGALLAVFRFSVPKPASHYLVDFCCYQKSKEDPGLYTFHDMPAYHGELHVDPATGAIYRITLQAELTDADPVMISSMAVLYGRVNIGGKDYICPVRGIAISEVHNLVMELIDGVGPEKHINEVRFSDYHKFASTARILTDSPDAEQQ